VSTTAATYASLRDRYRCNTNYVNTDKKTGVYKNPDKPCSNPGSFLFVKRTDKFK
jgi:hypothetical protein